MGALLALGHILSVALEALNHKEEDSAVWALPFGEERTGTIRHRVLNSGIEHKYRFRVRSGDRVTAKMRFINKRGGKGLNFGFRPPALVAECLEVASLFPTIDGPVFTEWSGVLPLAGNYEIRIPDPDPGSRLARHACCYNLQVSVDSAWL